MPFREPQTLKDVFDVVQIGQVNIAVNVEEFMSSRRNERHMRHCADGRDIFEQFNVGRCGPERVIADDCADRLATELAIA